ncbi:4Fe-4S dicluster domain-containing protein [Acidobacteriia bacterium AH_259_A11_L15]|nr:4Fe-4S dicluster domain-containing protein [Acidobacteriia bacterium AH_259_A11_L15]
MPRVYNWQLGREMLYPYQERHPRRQFAFVFNINRCIGCQTCTMACKSTWTFARGQEYMWWNNVESKPYGGYPQFWDQKLLALLERANPGGQVWNLRRQDGERSPYGVFEGKTIFEAISEEQNEEGETFQETSGRVLGYLPSDQEWEAPNIYEDTPRRPENHRHLPWGGVGESLPAHQTWFFHLQRICNHCTYPGCLAACPRQAIYKRQEDGVVLIDQERCRGYRKCVEGCPYKKSMYRGTTRTSEKCIACYPRLEGRDSVITPDGVPIETRCMAACVGKIRMQGLVKIARDGAWAPDPENPIYYMVKEEKVALPLYPQFGTEPNGYYIPPRWVPLDYLTQMFGPEAERAVEAYVCPSRRMLALLQLFRVSQRIIFGFKLVEGKKIAESEATLLNGKKKTLEIFNDTVIGYDSKGREIVQLTVEEPVFERSPEHYNSI